MSYTIEHLKAEDRQDALDFLNMVFSMEKAPHDFLKALPKMWGSNGERMKYHIALKEDNHIRAIVGVYPLPVHIGEETLMFYTMGNVATHPHFKGQGYMSALLDVAMRELHDLNADAARLGGLRQRYARYGYEPCGSRYDFTLNRNNVLRFYEGKFASDLTFKPMTAQDDELLIFCNSLFEKNRIWVERKDATIFYESVTAWSSVPYIALRAGQPVGYLSVSKSGDQVQEFAAESEEMAVEMLCAWLESNNLPKLAFTVEPWQDRLCSLVQPLCEDWNIQMPSRFCIFHWDKVINALLKLKASYTPLLPGSCTVEIEGFGNVRLTVNGKEASCVETKEPASVSLTPAEAARVFFGPMPGVACCGKSFDALLLSWLPLPLSWNTMDRV